MNFFKVIGAVLSQPSQFFENVAKGKDNLSFAFGYFAILSLFATIVGIILNLMIQSFFPSLYSLGGLSTLGLFGDSFRFASIFIFPILSYIFNLGLSFVYAGLLHVWILLFSGDDNKKMKNYTKTYEMGAYAGTPSMLFGIIPLLGPIWSLVLLIIGTQKVHGFPKKKAVLMYVIPVAALLFLGVVLGIFFFIFALGFISEVLTGVVQSQGGLTQ